VQRGLHGDQRVDSTRGDGEADGVGVRRGRAGDGQGWPSGSGKADVDRNQTVRTQELRDDRVLGTEAVAEVEHDAAGRSSDKEECCAVWDLRLPGSRVLLRGVHRTHHGRELPDEGRADRFRFEPKMDGWRCLAIRRAGDRVELQSRQHRPLTGYFPEIVAAVLAQLPPATVLDGELVVCRDGRLEFPALQHRIHRARGAAEPCTFVAFDVLALAGRDLRGLP